MKDLSLSQACDFFRILTIVLFAVSAVLFIVSITLKFSLYKRHRSKTFRKRIKTARIIGFVLSCIILAGSCLSAFQYSSLKNELLISSIPSNSTNVSTTVTTTEAETESTSEPPTESVTKPEPLPVFSPKAVKESSPDNWKIKWDIMANGAITNKYVRPEKISFGSGEDYSKTDGIVTFRGDNYRSGATYSTAKIEKGLLTQKWNSYVGKFNDWEGCGWTGQPLVVRWDKETKEIMNMYPEKKAKEGLVEAVYATLDGKIYFFDIEDGSYTRDPINMSMNFKGAGALDPRGYPLLYVGSGIYYNEKAPRIYVVSLIDGKILYEQTGYDSFQHRNWGAFDSSPLVNAETDTLIWPCENGVIYTIKLNTNYDKEAGKISVKPENTAKIRYSTGTGRTLGFESSIVAVGEYLFAADNGGMFFCFNANTMKLVWAQNVRDDVNATPVFEWGKDGKGYLYVATSMEYGKGNSYIYKLDASNGKILWERKYSKILYDKGVSGGILGSPMLGKKGTDAEGLIIYPVGKTNMTDAGILVALDTETGKTVWEKPMNSYAWSSPTAVYTDDGKAYVLTGIAYGTVYLIDAKTGETVTSIHLGSTIEASPVVFENTIILGTRANGVFGIEIS